MTMSSAGAGMADSLPNDRESQFAGALPREPMVLKPISH
nr:MAG TPA_asm: hypothetical protein [Caudoviricetes sp.]